MSANVSRRSFFAIVAGALAASRAPRLVADTPEFQRFESLWNDLKEQCHHLVVWDSFTVTPGKVAAAKLFPPPMPERFLVQKLYWHANPECPVSDLVQFVREASAKVDYAGTALVASASLSAMPWCSLVGPVPELPVPLLVQKDKPFSCAVEVPALDISQPVSVSLVLSGIAKA